LSSGSRGEGGGRGEVLLLAHRGNALSAVYAAPGRAGRNRIDADFGEFGRVDLRWTRHRIEQRKPSEGCVGRPTTIGRGVFHGTIELRGQEGFVEVHVDHVRGGFRQYRHEVCQISDDRYAPEYARPHHGRGHPGDADLFATNVLQATSEAAGRTVELIVSEPGLPGLEFFDATATELIGQVQISTYAHALGKGESLTFSDERPPHSASLTPPEPFAGSATFKRAGHSPGEWAGDLTAPLPGMGDVPLTGEAFEVKVCRRDLASGFEGCGPP
ncbi:MAG TPA: hypothetical protein VFJ99_05805, partial [Solirubrobacterales bacterium]|nr:hypothetical protein [Solirubrobacterales bacterium]